MGSGCATTPADRPQSPASMKTARRHFPPHSVFKAVRRGGAIIRVAVRLPKGGIRCSFILKKLLVATLL